MVIIINNMCIGRTFALVHERLLANTMGSVLLEEEEKTTEEKTTEVKTKEDYKKKEVPEKDRIIAELQTEVTTLKRRVREWERKEDERRYKV